MQEFKADNLIAGDYPIMCEAITIDKGQNLKRGSVLGKITEKDVYVLSSAGESDGSQNPMSILAQDVDGSDEPKSTFAYFSGQFNQDSLILGKDHTLSTIKDNLRSANIYLTNAQ